MVSTTSLTCTLRQFAIGESATIQGWGDLPPAFRQQLMAMGLTRSTRVTVVARAPFGDPISLSVRGSLLCLRQDEIAALQWARCR